MLNEKKVVPKLRQEVKVKVDIVTSDDIKTFYTGKFQDFTARYVIKLINMNIIYLATWSRNSRGTYHDYRSNVGILSSYERAYDTSCRHTIAHTSCFKVSDRGPYLYREWIE